MPKLVKISVVKVPVVTDFSGKSVETVWKFVENSTNQLEISFPTFSQ